MVSEHVQDEVTKLRKPPNVQPTCPSVPEFPLIYRRRHRYLFWQTAIVDTIKNEPARSGHGCQHSLAIGIKDLLLIRKGEAVRNQSRKSAEATLGSRLARFMN